MRIATVVDKLAVPLDSHDVQMVLSHKPWSRVPGTSRAPKGPQHQAKEALWKKPPTAHLYNLAAIIT